MIDVLEDRVSGVEIEFTHVTKRFPGQEQPAVSDLSLTVEAGQICCLVGPSGGGKTTAMKLVNRLIEPTEGDILIGGKSITDSDPVELRRGIGYVIQETGLFPHMTIGENIGVVPQLLGWPKKRTTERAAELLKLVNLEPEMAKRYPAQLSGGQRQRVGLARALAADPPLMLMDEPFGALDHITRSMVQDEFLRVHREVGKTVLFVTHDIDEAIKMADKIAVFRQGGVLAQYAAPDELLAHPADDFVADLVGADRGIKRLSLRTAGELADSGGTAADGTPRVEAGTTLRETLALLLSEGAQEASVHGDAGPVGVITLEKIRQVAGAS
ncbi:MAG: ABC transporter ATP-binding protein [Streptosporangiales bacterium]|nr:ABC transporter ATP-binding protein [Streptosporangiales bacterium]